MIIAFRRRFLLAALAVAASASRSGVAHARPKRVVHLATAVPMTDSAAADMRLYRRSIWARHGMREGHDYYERVVVALADDDLWRLAREIVAERPDLIMVNAGVTARIFQQLTADIPVVFYAVTDALRWGLIQSYQRPGWNLTGASSSRVEALNKRLAIHRELRPTARRMALLTWDEKRPPIHDEIFREAETAAIGMGMELAQLAFPRSFDVDAVARMVRASRVEGIVFQPAPLHAEQPIALQARSGVPIVDDWKSARRGLVAGFAHADDMFDRGVGIAARVLRGESPASIPVEEPRTWRLVVNVAAARSLGIEVPQSILARADEIVH